MPNATEFLEREETALDLLKTDFQEDLYGDYAAEADLDPDLDPDLEHDLAEREPNVYARIAEFRERLEQIHDENPYSPWYAQKRYKGRELLEELNDFANETKSMKAIDAANAVDFVSQEERSEFAALVGPEQAQEAIDRLAVIYSDPETEDLEIDDWISVYNAVHEIPEIAAIEGTLSDLLTRQLSGWQAERPDDLRYHVAELLLLAEEHIQVHFGHRADPAADPEPLLARLQARWLSPAEDAEKTAQFGAERYQSEVLHLGGVDAAHQKVVLAIHEALNEMFPETAYHNDGYRPDEKANDLHLAMNYYYDLKLVFENQTFVSREDYEDKAIDLAFKALPEDPELADWNLAAARAGNKARAQLFELMTDPQPAHIMERSAQLIGSYETYQAGQREKDAFLAELRQETTAAAAD